MNAPAKLLTEINFGQYQAHDFEILEGDYAGRTARYYGVVETDQEDGWWVFFTDPSAEDGVLLVKTLYLKQGVSK